MHDYSSRHLIVSSKNRVNNTGPIKVILIVIILLVAVYFSLFRKPTKEIPKKEITETKIEQTPIQKNNSQKELLAKMDTVMATMGGTYSVYIYDINKDEGFGLHEETYLTAASINKIPILATLYNLAGKNEIDLEKVITLQSGEIQNYGSGTIRYDAPGTQYSLKTLGRLMMEKSDNTAAYILASEILGMDKIQSYLDSLDLSQTNMEDNKTSTKDMANLLIKMYKGQITSKQLTNEMLGFMKKSDYDDRIPAGVDENITIYHKTGDEIGKIHDVGIVNIPNRPYFIGIMTLDMTDDAKTKNAMASVSKMTFEYMKQ